MSFAFRKPYRETGPEHRQLTFGVRVLAVFCCVCVMLAAFLVFEVGLFRFSCILCDVPRPGVMKSVGIVLLLLIVPAITDGFQTAVLIEVYRSTDYPLWEAGVVDFLLALPVHMVICSALHARTMRIRVREGLAVWFVEKIVKLAMLSAIAGVVALLVLAREAAN